jgi:FHA domain-containing protein
MAILRDFEHRLERIVEGFFTKAFRSGLQPVELAKRVLREMEAGKTVGVREVWVPNRYVLHLSDEDRKRLAGMEKALGRELERVVVEGARERGFGLVARPEVVFETDGDLRRGDFSVVSELTEETGPPSPDEEPLPGRPMLALIEGGNTVKQFSLESDTALIGRLAGSEVEISDPGASRRHAEVRRQGDRFVIVDLGSTNGTLVNDDPVSERPLEDGDRITIGQTTLEFRKG